VTPENIAELFSCAREHIDALVKTLQNQGMAAATRTNPLLQLQATIDFAQRIHLDAANVNLSLSVVRWRDLSQTIRQMAEEFERDPLIAARWVLFALLELGESPGAELIMTAVDVALGNRAEAGDDIARQALDYPEATGMQRTPREIYLAELRPYVRQLAEAIAKPFVRILPDPDPGELVSVDLAELPERDGMLAWDAELADRIEPLDAEGAENIREAARDRWERYTREELPLPYPVTLLKLWWPNVDDCEKPCKLWMIHLALALWPRVRPLIERTLRCGPPAMARSIWVDVIEPLATPAERLQAEQAEPDPLILDGAGQRICAARANVVDMIISGTARSVYFLRTFAAVLWLTHKHWDKHGNVRDLRIEGGWQAFAELAGLGGNQRRVTRALDLGCGIIIQTEQGRYGGLWTYRVERPTKGRRAVLWIRPGYLLVPPREGLREPLYPVLPPDYPLPLPTGPNLRAKALRIAQRALVWMRDHAIELATREYVPDAPWEEWRRREKLSARDIDLIRGLLLEGDDKSSPKSSPLLRRPEPGRPGLDLWIGSGELWQIRRWIIKAGNRALCGRKGGIASGRARRKRGRKR
jgi:hypothetical protein